MAHQDGPDRQRADPSAWSRRVPVIVLALVGCAIATYLAAYQMQLLSTIWDPLFGHGSEVVVSSGIARALPIPDAALGAFAYLVEAVTGAIGGRDRWRTMPWIVLLYGAVVVSLALTSVGLVLAQVLIFHTGCTLCLISAAISFLNAWFARDEVLASFKYVNGNWERQGSRA